MIRLFKQNWYNPKFRSVTESLCRRCLTCQQINPGGKTIVPMGKIGKAEGPFLRLQLDFIELPPCRKLKYVLVIVCLFSRWVEAYPTRRNDGLTVAKLLLRELIPRFGFPLSLESDRGPHFNNEVIRLICTAFKVDQKLHCPYRPEASGVVEQINGTIKSRLSKMCQATSMEWPDALPLVLMSLRNVPDKNTGLSPHEILMGRAMRQAHIPGNRLLSINDDLILDYCKQLAELVRSISRQVGEGAVDRQILQAHDLNPGDWVRVKKHARKTCLAPRWGDPCQVVLVTNTAVKCQGLPNWVHASHTKRVPAPEPIEAEETAEGCVVEESVIPDSTEDLERPSSAREDWIPEFDYPEYIPQTRSQTRQDNQEEEVNRQEQIGVEEQAREKEEETVEISKQEKLGKETHTQVKTLEPIPEEGETGEEEHDWAAAKPNAIRPDQNQIEQEQGTVCIPKETQTETTKDRVDLKEEQKLTEEQDENTEHKKRALSDSEDESEKQPRKKFKSGEPVSNGCKRLKYIIKKVDKNTEETQENQEQTENITKGEQILRKSKRTKVANKKYTGPDWTYLILQAIEEIEQIRKEVKGIIEREPEKERPQEQEIDCSQRTEESSPET